MIFCESVRDLACHAYEGYAVGGILGVLLWIYIGLS